MASKNYIVYMHENRKNKKKYIGITCQKPEARWKNGLGYTSQYFSRAITRYGWDMFNHYILFTNLSKEEAELKEKELIKKYKTSKPYFGYNIALGGNSPDSISEETRKKLSEKALLRKQTEETKRKISEYSKTRIGCKNPFYGKHHTEETKKKISKKIICVETNELYYSIKEASDITKIGRTSINNCLKGWTNTAGGFHWKYIGDKNVC